MSLNTARHCAGNLGVSFLHLIDSANSTRFLQSVVQVQTEELKNASCNSVKNLVLK